MKKNVYEKKNVAQKDLETSYTISSDAHFRFDSNQDDEPQLEEIVHPISRDKTKKNTTFI